MSPMLEARHDVVQSVWKKAPHQAGPQKLTVVVLGELFGGDFEDVFLFRIIWQSLGLAPRQTIIRWLSDPHPPFSAFLDILQRLLQ